MGGPHTYNTISLVPCADFSLSQISESSEDTLKAVQLISTWYRWLSLWTVYIASLMLLMKI